MDVLALLLMAVHASVDASVDSQVEASVEASVGASDEAPEKALPTMGCWLDASLCNTFV